MVGIWSGPGMLPPTGGLPRCPEAGRRPPGPAAAPGRRPITTPVQPASQAAEPTSSKRARVPHTRSSVSRVVPNWSRGRAEDLQDGGQHRLVGDARLVTKVPGLSYPPAFPTTKVGTLRCRATPANIRPSDDHRVVQDGLAPGVQRVGHVQRLSSRSILVMYQRWHCEKIIWFPCEVLWCGNPRSTGTMALPSALPACRVATRVTPGDQRARQDVHLGVEDVREVLVLVSVLGVALQGGRSFSTEASWPPAATGVMPGGAHRRRGRRAQRAQRLPVLAQLVHLAARILEPAGQLADLRVDGDRANRW